MLHILYIIAITAEAMTAALNDHRLRRRSAARYPLQ